MGTPLGRVAPGCDGSCAILEPTARALTGLPTASAARSPRGRAPQAFCVQVRGPHSHCFSSKPHVHLRSRGLDSPWAQALPRTGAAPRGTLPGQGHPAGTWARHSQALQAPQPSAVRPQMLDAVVAGDACVGGEARQGPDPGPRGGGPGDRRSQAGTATPPRLSARGLHCVQSASYRRKARGTSSVGRVVSLGETYGQEQTESKRQRVLPVPNGKSVRTNTEAGATPAQYRDTSSSAARTDRSSEQRPGRATRSGPPAEAQR